MNTKIERERAEENKKNFYFIEKRVYGGYNAVNG